MNYILNFLSAVFKVVVCTPPMRATAILSIYTKVIFNLMLKRTSESISSAFNRCIYFFFIIFSEHNEKWVAGRGEKGQVM